MMKKEDSKIWRYIKFKIKLIDLLSMAEKIGKSNTAANKRKSTKPQQETPENKNNKNNNVFTEKHFNPNENFSNYLRDHK